MRHCFFFSNNARGFMRHCYFSYIIFTGSWINSFLASAWHFSYCLSYLGIGFKHLYPQFVCCSKFEWSTWHPCVCEEKESVLGQAWQPSPNAARAAAAWSGGHGDASPWVGPSWWQEGSAATCSWLSSSSSTSTCTGRHPRICSWTCYPVHHFDPIWVIVTFLWCYRIVFMEANSTR